MKKRIKLIILAICIPFIVNAQCWNTVNTASTDWRITNPINTFDWTAETYDFFYIGKYAVGSTVPATSLVLPMWAPSPSVARNSNLDHFQQIITAQDKDFWPEDGWELLIKDFGEPGGVSQATDNPFYVLYNKYLGKMRVFYLSTEKPADKKANSAAITIEFLYGTRKTALFQSLNPISKPLISFNPNNQFRTPNYYATEDLYWLYSEVDVPYDPCTCHLTSDSKIRIQARIITTSTINATLNGTLNQKVTEPGSNGTGVPSISNSLFTIGKFDLVDGAKKGQKAYKEWEGYQKEAVKFLQQQDSAFQKKFKKEIFTDYDGWIIGDSVYTDFDRAKLDPDFWKAVFTLLPTENSKPLKDLAGALPYVGAAISLIDFFSSGGAEENTAPKASTPISFEANLTLKGTLSLQSNISEKVFFTPGSKTGGVNFIPTYNNILGVFNVLNVPPLEYAEYAPTYNTGNPSDDGILASSPMVRQYRLSSPLKYVINSAADVEIESILASYIIEFDSTIVFSATQSPMNDEDQMITEFGRIGLSVKTNATEEALSKDIVKRIENTGLELDYRDKEHKLRTSDNKFVGGTIRFRTPYVPLECFEDQVFTLFRRNFTSPLFRNKPPRVFIKMHIKLNRKDANGDPIVFVRSYQMPELSNSTAAPFTTGGKYKVNKHFLQSSGTSAWVDYADQIIGDPFFATDIAAKSFIHYKNGDVISRDVYARDSIVIDSGVIILTGVKIKTKGYVNVKSGVDIPSGVEILGTINPTLCDNLGKIANFHMSDAEITTICNSQIYIDNANASSPPPNKDRDDNEDESSTLEALVYPNPSQDKVSIQVKRKAEGTYNVVMYDYKGQVVMKKSFVGNDNPIFEINLSHLSPALYIVELSDENDVVYRTKLMKQ